MKNLIKLFILAIAFTFTSQINAQKLTTNEVDEFTGSIKKATKEYKLFKGDKYAKLDVRAGRIDSFYYLYLSPRSDLGCVGTKDSYVIFIFDDGSKLKLDDDLAQIDCSKYASFIYNIDQENPIFTRSKEVEKIRVCGSKYYNDYSPTGKYTLGELLDAVK
ncbi:hypothetical protein N8Z19_02000 [Saprospiraceae bacterium]|nr:hypothetical protein [Saprospiraceae bacterium]